MKLFPLIPIPLEDPRHPKRWTARILNVNPDSKFCDNITEYADFLQALARAVSEGVSIIDIGAESTSPFNVPVGAEAEWARLEDTLIRALREEKWPIGKVLSLDTFRLETIAKFLDECRRWQWHEKIPLIWNDVSGKTEKEVLHLLFDYPDLRLVISHNAAPTRAETPLHKRYEREELAPEELWSEVKTFFYHKVEFLLSEGIRSERLLLDPCFGFSKTKEQSLYILQHMPELMLSMAEKYGHDITWMIGISRKRMLREQDDDSLDTMDARQTILAAPFFKNVALKDIPLIFRVHNPASCSCKKF